MELGDLAQLLRSSNGYPSPKDKDTLIGRHKLNQALSKFLILLLLLSNFFTIYNTVGIL
jgi:hypothetical protein